MSGIAGQRKRAPMRGDQARQKMWNSMRILRRFTTADLQATAEIGNSHCRKYVKRLLDAGYLRVAQPKREGVSGGHAIYALVRDSGVHAPRISKDGAHDPNLAPKGGAKTIAVLEQDYQWALRCVRACAGMQDPESEVAALRAGGAL